MKKNKNYILLGICAVLAVSIIFTTIESTTTGVTMSHLEGIKAQETAQKQELEGTLVKSISVATLSEKSVDMGFTNPESIVYVGAGQGEAVAEAR